MCEMNTGLIHRVRRLAVLPCLLIAGIFMLPALLVAQSSGSVWEEIVWGRSGLPNTGLAAAGFTPDGRYIVASSTIAVVQGETRVFDRVSGLLVWRLPSFHRAASYSSTVGRLAIVEYHRGDTDDIDQLEIWDIGTRERVSTVTGRFGGILSLSLSADGGSLAFSCGDSTVHVWDIEEDRMVRSWKLDSLLSYVHISPSGRYIFGLWGMFGPYAKGWMWDVETGEPTMKMIRRYFNPFSGFAFSPDERYFAMQETFGGNDFGVSLYGVPDGEPIREYYGSKDESKRLDYWGFMSVAFSPDGTRLASFYGNQYSMLWDVETGDRLDTIRHGQDHVSSVLSAYVLDKDNRSLLLGSAIGELNTWDFSDHRLVQFTLRGLADNDLISQTAFSGSGNYLVAAYSHGHLRLFDAQTGDTIRTISHSEKRALGVFGLDVSSDDSLIAAGGRDSVLVVYRLSSGAELWRSGNRGSTVWDVKFSPGGDRVAASSETGVTVYDAGTGDSIAFIDELQDTALFAFSPDGWELATVGRAGRIRVWDVRSGLPLRDVGEQNAPREIAWSGDGAVIATCGADGSVHVRDAESGALIRSFHHESGSVNGVAFTPDSRYLLSGGEDETLRVWHLGGGFEVYRYRDFPVAVTTLSVSGDGKSIATGSRGPGYDYRLIVRHGVESYVSVPDAPVSATLSSSFTVSPNPSRGAVRVSFVLPGPSHVRLRVVDALGRVLSEPVNGMMREGRHEFPLPVGGFAPGTYFCRLESGDERVTRALTLPK